jgi:hypothetical protein
MFGLPSCRRTTKLVDALLAHPGADRDPWRSSAGVSELQTDRRLLLGYSFDTD